MVTLLTIIVALAALAVGFIVACLAFGKEVVPSIPNGPEDKWLLAHRLMYGDLSSGSFAVIDRGGDVVAAGSDFYKYPTAPSDSPVWLAGEPLTVSPSQLERLKKATTAPSNAVPSSSVTST